MELGCGWEADHTTNGVLLVKNQNEHYRSMCNLTNFVQCGEYILHPRVMFSPGFTARVDSSTNQSYALLRVVVRMDRKVGMSI